MVISKIRFFSILVAFTVGISTLNAQTVTVIVEDRSLLELDKLDVYLNVTETKYDSPKLISTDNLATELNKIQLEGKLINSRIDSTFYKKGTRQEQIRITKTSNLLIVIDNFKDRDQFLGLIRKYSNTKIDSTSILSKNADETLKIITKDLISKAKIEANKMAKLVDRKATKLANIKVLHNGAGGTITARQKYVLQEGAYVKLEVTFETENI